MKKIYFTVCAAVLLASAGCASTREKDVRLIADLRLELSSASQKFDLAKKENLNLKRELLVYKKYQDLDAQQLAEAVDLVRAALAFEVAEDNVWLELSERGLLITVSAEILFMTASDNLSDAGKGLLDKIAELVKQNFPQNYIYIEGHTDNQSLAVFEWKTDWDFSFARALNVLKYLTEKKGLDPLKFSASGFGQYRPRAGNDTKEGRRLNRRVVIVISPQSTRQEKLSAQTSS
ncbi:MAG: OmpA family protein [Candidatus Omnitrophota bacterium]